MHLPRIPTAAATATVIAIICSVGCAGESAEPLYLDVAAAAGIKSSGLLDELLPAFARESGVAARVHATDSGRALAMLSDGVVDMSITHAPRNEARHLAQHGDWRYRKIAFNRFFIVGPPYDPAGIRDARDAADAFRRIAVSGVNFISRSDPSGTRDLESNLWEASGTRPLADRLVVSADSMAVALQYTDERVAYTLSDEATFRQLRPTLAVDVLFSDDDRLVNTYGVTYAAQNRAAQSFVDWVTADAVRQRLANYRIAGWQAFSAWPEGCANDRPELLPCDWRLQSPR